MFGESRNRIGIYSPALAEQITVHEPRAEGRMALAHLAEVSYDAPGRRHPGGSAFKTCATVRCRF